MILDYTDSKRIIRLAMDPQKKNEELVLVIVYAFFFYTFIINRSLHISNSYFDRLFGLRSGWISHRLNDVSDAQWGNFRSNLPILSVVFGLFTIVDVILGTLCKLKSRGKSIYWLVVSLTYLLYLHGTCIIFILTIATVNFSLVKCFGRTQFFSPLIWIFNVGFLISNRVYEGYSFSYIWKSWSYLDNFRGTFRWQICFNFVILRMLSFGYDFHWALHDSNFDYNKERNISNEKFNFTMYLCYLLYAPLYISGPIVSFNAFASQMSVSGNRILWREIILYGLRWVFAFVLMEFITHFLYYNAFAKSGLWSQLPPVDIFIIGYGVLNFMWLKFFLIWRYFRFWSMINGIQTPENMPRCINNCYSLETFWKNWHSSYNKWIVRYMYIPLGGSQRKMINIWVIFTFVALWHDLEWKLLSWAWITCLIFVPEMAIKSASKSFEVEHVVGKFVFRELRAVFGSITITCLMVANIVGYVIGPSEARRLAANFLGFEGIAVLLGMLVTFYVGTKLMFHIDEAKQKGGRGLTVRLLHPTVSICG